MKLHPNWYVFAACALVEAVLCLAAWRGGMGWGTPSAFALGTVAPALGLVRTKEEEITKP